MKTRITAYSDELAFYFPLYNVSNVVFQYSHELKKLSYWLRPSSRVVLFLCDPVVRYLQYLYRLLQTIEHTDVAIQHYIKSSITKAQVNKATACIMIWSLLFPTWLVYWWKEWPESFILLLGSSNKINKGLKSIN